jgi:hypothetical protein
MATEGFLERYRRFFQRRDTASGFEFHNPPPKSVPLPTVLFREKLHWWSWDRWQRRKRIRAERDRRVQEIVAMKPSKLPSTPTSDTDAWSQGPGGIDPA